MLSFATAVAAGLLLACLLPGPAMGTTTGEHRTDMLRQQDNHEDGKQDCADGHSGADSVQGCFGLALDVNKSLGGGANGGS